VAIIADYNAQYGTAHTLNNFDAYYQDIQQRIKNHKYPDRDLPRRHAEKIDIVIVVDMLLTGFDSQYLNTLYVDKNLKYHGLIQAFSRTNRILNDTKPYGNILDFRAQQNEVEQAIALFSGKSAKSPREIWLVESAPEVITKLQGAMEKLESFMSSQGLSATPSDVSNLQGDEARSSFINLFKEVQRLKTQLEQYTDLSVEHIQSIDTIIDPDTLRGFKSAYLETAKRLKERQGKGEDSPIEELDFEFVLFASALVDYDYIMGLIARFTQNTGKQKMSREQLVGLIASDAKFIDEREEIAEYIDTLIVGEGLSEEEVRRGFEDFKSRKQNRELFDIAHKHGLETAALKEFTDNIIARLIFDGESLSDLMAPLGLGWKERTKRELSLMHDLIPLLRKMAQGHEISGLGAYEE